ncbi:hypothetical protein MicloDRAFT_00030800 [Microvirga lotononidis]|uniref:Uncharacterized protein n=1 Tax=Microvirga lotononidis TaxID=864069 RepID=I4YRD9_9HYPH|nr:hypothetical protein MicloDRAFT_00030800 [Microvirga lotononidis]
MSSRSKYISEWKKAQKALLPDMRETKAFVSSETYDQLVELAQSRNERLPLTIGRVLDFALSVIHQKEPEELKPEPIVSATLEVPAEALLKAILASRFPTDTGAARLRQFAFVQILAEHNARGEGLSSTELANLTGGFRSQMDLMAKLLMGRGIITRKHATGHKGAKNVKLLMIAKDALKNLNDAHIAETGEPIEGIKELKKMGR